MKLRIPDSLEHAITVLLATLGDAECEQITGRTASLIRKASDPDKDYMLPLDIALRLDKAFMEMTGEMPPIMRVWTKAMDLVQMTENPEGGDVVQCALVLQHALGIYSQKVREFTDSTSAGGQQLTRNEASVIMAHLDEIERAAARTKEMVKRQMNINNNHQ